MKFKKTKLLALLLVCAMGLATTTACGKDTDEAESDGSSSVADADDSTNSNGDNSNNDNGGDGEASDEDLLRQNLTISDYDVSEDESANVPVNEGVAYSSSSDDEDVTYVTVTDTNGNPITDDDGNVVTQAVTNNNSSSNSSSSSDTDAEDEYTPSIAGKLLYWLDMSKYEDYVFNGDFIDVTFRVKDSAPDGNYTIGIGTCDFANYDAVDLEYDTANGDIAVGSATQAEAVEATGNGIIKLSTSTESAQQGDEVTVHFYINDNPGVVGFIFRFTYDQNALEFVDVAVGEDCADCIELE